jgi:hypothetical protein
MKKTIFYVIFTISYASILSLGAECLLNLLSVTMAISLDGGAITDKYPRFIPFCLIVGVVTLILLISLIALNVKFSNKLKYCKNIWIAQSICAFLISVPMIGAWELLFRFLQASF